MSEIHIGDFVTWKSAEHPNALALKHCKVVEFGVDEQGRPAAMIEAFGNPVGALMKDLTREDE